MYKFEDIKASKLLNEQFIRPECQRFLNNEQVDKLTTFQITYYNKYNNFFFTNPISIARINKNSYIIDGQHRLECIKNLINSKKYEDFDIKCVIIDIKSEEEMDDIYMALNQNTPVPLPSDIKIWKHFSKHIEKYLTENFNSYISHSETPRFPNFNKTRLLNYIDNNDIHIKLDYDYKAFIKEFNELNTFYKRNCSILSDQFKDVGKKIEKSRRKQDNYLVLFIYNNFEWVDRIVDKICTNKNYSEMKHITKIYRIKIKKKLRKEVWMKRNGDTINGNCFCCNEKIDIHNFECGHITSVYYGGNTTLDNLEPVCRECNREMGVKNLFTYKKEIEQ